MITVIASRLCELSCWGCRIKQSGIALLQVLLISTIISLIAIQFSHTARDQIQMSLDVEGRIKAQLRAHSALAEATFLVLSEDMEEAGFGARLLHLASTPVLNFYGHPIVWDEGVTVSFQDLNGLLPQNYPGHVMWEKVLYSLGVEQSKVPEYLGIWADIQDPDLEAWNLTGEEPRKLPSGPPYLNGFSQTDRILDWVFSDEPNIIKTLRDLSDVRAPYDTNIFNAPDIVLRHIVDEGVLQAITNSRLIGPMGQIKARASLPAEYLVDHVYIYNSDLVKITVSVESEHSSWIEKRTLKMTSGSDEPFKVLVND